MRLTREQILGAQTLPRELVPVPEFGGEVWVAVMPGIVRDAWERSMVTAGAPNLDNMRAKLVAACVVDDNGERLFTEADIDALGQKNWMALERITKVAQRLNQLGDDAMEKIQGNSEPTRGGDSSSL